MTAIEVNFDEERGILNIFCDESNFARLRDLISNDPEIAAPINAERDVSASIANGKITSIALSKAVALPTKPQGFREQLMNPPLYFFPLLGSVLVVLLMLFIFAIGLMTLWNWTVGA